MHGVLRKNVTPSLLKVGQRDSLQQLCDCSLQEVVELLQVEWLVGVGSYICPAEAEVCSVGVH